MINDRDVQIEQKKKNRNVIAERTVTGPNPGHLNGRYHTAA